MRRNVVNFFFHRIHRFHRISYIILQQELMRWIYVRNAVNFALNFCKKCGEMWWIFFSPHSLQSSHFLQKFTAFTAFLTKKYPKTSTRVVGLVFQVHYYFKRSNQMWSLVYLSISTNKRQDDPSKNECDSQARYCRNLARSSLNNYLSYAIFAR